MMQVRIFRVAACVVLGLLCQASAEMEAVCEKNTPGCDEPISLMQNPTTRVNSRQKGSQKELSVNVPEEGDVASMLQKQVSSTKYAALHSQVAKSSYMQQVIAAAKEHVASQRKQRAESKVAPTPLKK
mmetsp:Transcript_135463/g.235578  ORF Transcript_135463/g.235578 Transcript_135463/m.235578 type:complete len:128 (+) Transcript_135463:56-439(+)